MIRRLAILTVLGFFLQSGAQAGWDLSKLNADKVVAGGSKVVKAASGIPEADEIAIGQDVAQKMEAKFGVLQDAKRTAYIDQIGQTLAKKSSRPNLTYHFTILDSPDINAFAAPGGFIFITKGILDFLKDESELAGIIGHEIGHVTQKHVIKAIQKANLLSAGADFASAYGSNPQLREELANFTTNLLIKGLSRQDELEADAVGTELMTTGGGYTPLGMRDAMARLGQMEGKSSIVKHLTQTHPPAADRVKAINQVIESKKLPTNGQRQKARFETQLRGA